MTVKLRVYGQRDDADLSAARGGATRETVEGTVTDLLDTVEVITSFNLSPAARAITKAPVVLQLKDDDLLEIEVEGGFTTWVSAKRYSEEVPLLKPETRSQDDTVTVDTVPQVSDRGVSDWVANKLRVLRVKDNIKDELNDLIKTPLDQWPSSLADLKQLVQDLGLGITMQWPAWLVTKALIRLIEARLKPGPGLYTWEDATKQPWTDERSPANLDHIDVDKPILVFIHGTASSTRGSFNGLLAVDAQPQWDTLRQIFDGRVYAFEHRTLSDSPIDNAIDLLRALPPKARVNIVSHSRGGLIGDLISLKSIDPDLLERFKRGDKRLEKADLHDRKQLAELMKEIEHRQLRIERFVRCAAPSRGTLLAGENIDVFLSVLTNLVNLIPGVGGTPLYEVTKRIALEIIRSRTEPSMVPGIESMMPQSPLVALLNNVTTPAGGDIGVVAGDVAGGNWLKRLGVFASDHIVYESRDNDLVVNTDAMFNGARRAVAGYVFDQGAEVSHFNYFKNPRTRSALVDWLAAKAGARPAGFLEIKEGGFDPVPMMRALQTRDGADQPVVFVVPDVMGSHLRIDSRQIWPSYDALLNGGISQLAIGASRVEPSGLLGDGYQALCGHLQQSHIVIPFAYDWRMSIADTAALLASEVEARLEKSKQPVRFIAHGMGGLVVRAMIAARGDLWDRICQHDDARFVMLGTPNRGSFDIVETLLGTSPMIRQLELLDLDHDLDTIIDILTEFPGLLEMLPDEDEYFGDALWDDYRRKLSGATTPDAARLTAARETLESIASHVSSVIPHADHVLCVAGASPRTAIGVDIIDGRPVLSVTPDGDGRVTYQSSILQGVPTWYMDAAHGDLTSHSPSFPALTELLATGATARLTTAPPSTAGRGGTVTLRALPEPVLYPTESSLAAGILGKQPRRSYLPQRQPGFRVSVVHGDLRFARYPIVVGHYEGDTIVGAEAEVDKQLGGALSQRYSLGLYPGAFGSIAVILRKPTVVQEALHLPSGAVIVGLGKWGELSAQQLAELVRRAALQYVLQLCDSVGPTSDDRAAASIVGLSVLLVGGASTTNITVGDSVGAILRAVAQANRELAGTNCNAMTIEEVQIIELYADRATEAAHSVNRLAPLIGNELHTSIDSDPLLHPARGARQRLRLTAEHTAWRRWQVSAVSPPQTKTPARIPKPLLDHLKRAVLNSGSNDTELLTALTELAFGQDAQPEAHREIRFVSLSERARAEAVIQDRQPELVERLIKSAISQTRFLQEESRVLYEVMVPKDLKSSLTQVDNLVLVVDAETAAYPWELMSAGGKPLCIEKGLVRQLQTVNYRPQLGTRAGEAALVVGDPRVSPPFPQLPGAAAEAQAVYEILSAGGLEVEQPVSKPTALEVLASLYTKPYRIMHLAGHGYYESPTTAEGKARSGLVLDNGIFLTAVEVEQMQQVPELVFLNCCHIGQTGPEDTTGTSGAPGGPTVEFNRLAASISRELIEMGVRAIVAAGWAVRDDAAKDFAEIFYQRMLDGETFGNALKMAREHTYGKFPLANTWGAYQAYGDPDYCLFTPDAGGRRTNDGRVAMAEFIEAVSDIGATSKDDGASSADAVKKLDELEKACPPGWLTETAVQMAIGRAYGDHREFEKARGYLEQALAGEGKESTTTLRAVEELANYEARLGNEFSDSAVTRLKNLIAVAETAERRSLLGGTYRRRAEAESDAANVRAALANAAESYRRAHELNGQRDVLNPYPTVNWLTCAAVLGDVVPEAAELLTRCEATAAERFAVDREYFSAVGMADAHLVRALMENRLSQDNPAAEDELDRLCDKYQQVIKQTAPTATDVDSTLRSIDSIANLLEKLAPADHAPGAMIDRLKALRGRISSEGTN